MPDIEVSDKTYQKLLELQAKEGIIFMSALIDRLIARYEDMGQLEARLKSMEARLKSMERGLESAAQLINHLRAKATTLSPKGDSPLAPSSWTSSWAEERLSQ